MGNKNSSHEFGKTSVYKNEIKIDNNTVNTVNTINTVEKVNIRPGYYKNKKNVYYSGISLNLSKKEKSSFKKLKYSYAKTNNFVYYKGEIIPEANSKTFIVLNRKNIPDEYKNLNSVIGMDFENNFKRIYQFGKLIYTISLI